MKKFVVIFLSFAGLCLTGCATTGSASVPKPTISPSCPCNDLALALKAMPIRKGEKVSKTTNPTTTTKTRKVIRPRAIAKEKKLVPHNYTDYEEKQSSGSDPVNLDNLEPSSNLSPHEKEVQRILSNLPQQKVKLSPRSY